MFLSHLLARTRFPHVICFVDVDVSAAAAVVALLFCLYFIIIIFRVILCFARQFLWKNSTFTFCFLFTYLPSAFCRLYAYIACVYVCVFDFEHFLWLFFVVAFYIFFIAPFSVLLVVFSARYALCRQVFSFIVFLRFFLSVPLSLPLSVVAVSINWIAFMFFFILTSPFLSHIKSRALR